MDGQVKKKKFSTKFDTHTHNISADVHAQKRTYVESSKGGGAGFNGACGVHLPALTKLTVLFTGDPGVPGSSSSVTVLSGVFEQFSVAHQLVVGRELELVSTS